LQTKPRSGVSKTSAHPNEVQCQTNRLRNPRPIQTASLFALARILELLQKFVVAAFAAGRPYSRWVSTSEQESAETKYPSYTNALAGHNPSASLCSAAPLTQGSLSTFFVRSTTRKNGVHPTTKRLWRSRKTSRHSCRLSLRRRRIETKPRSGVSKRAVRDGKPVPYNFSRSIFPYRQVFTECSC